MKLHHSPFPLGPSSPSLAFMMKFVIMKQFSVHFMSPTLNCKIHEAQDPVCLNGFCLPNLSTIIIIVVIITVTNIYCHIQCVWCCKKSFTWIISNHKVKSILAKQKMYAFWDSNTEIQNLKMPICTLEILHHVTESLLASMSSSVRLEYSFPWAELLLSITCKDFSEPDLQ